MMLKAGWKQPFVALLHLHINVRGGAQGCKEMEPLRKGIRIEFAMQSAMAQERVSTPIHCILSGPAGYD